MRVLHVVAPSEVGGIERVVQLLATAQQESGDTARVAAVSSEAESDTVGEFLAPLAAAGVESHRIVVGPRAYHRERAMLRELCDAVSPDVVHTHGYRADVVDGSGFRSAGLPTVSTAHGFVGGTARNRGYEWLQRRALRRYHGVAAVSRGVAGRLVKAGVSASRIRILPNAWHATRPSLSPDAARAELGLGGNAFRIGWIGRVEHEKGLDILLDALTMLRDLPAHVSVIGNGSLAPALRIKADAADLGARVTWHGVVPFAERVLPAFDVIVISSRTEGVPMVLLEAMACEVPVIATAVGGIPDTVGPAQALLLPPERPDAIAGALRSVYLDRADAAARARAARARVGREFSAETWVANYRSLYLDAMTRAVRR